MALIPDCYDLARNFKIRSRNIPPLDHCEILICCRPGKELSIQANRSWGSRDIVRLVDERQDTLFLYSVDEGTKS